MSLDHFHGAALLQQIWHIGWLLIVRLSAKSND